MICFFESPMASLLIVEQKPRAVTMPQIAQQIKLVPGMKKLTQHQIPLPYNGHGRPGLLNEILATHMFSSLGKVSDLAGSLHLEKPEESDSYLALLGI